MKKMAFDHGSRRSKNTNATHLIATPATKASAEAVNIAGPKSVEPLINCPSGTIGSHADAANGAHTVAATANSVARRALSAA